MSSRRKIIPASSLSAPVMPRRRRTMMLVLGIGLILGAVAGVVIGLILYFHSHTTIDLGTFTTTAPAHDSDDKQLYATYASSAACRDCHSTEFESWSKSHHG